MRKTFLLCCIIGPLMTLRPAGALEPTPAATGGCLPSPVDVGEGIGVVPAGPPGSAICHVVQRREWLWKIARSHLSSGASRQEIAELARTIYKYNRPAIGPNPHRLRPGMILFIRFDPTCLCAGGPVPIGGS